MCFVPGIPRALAEKPGLDKVTLQLQWTHQFQFAGYYAAKEKGFYRDAGLDVELLELKPGLDSVQEVAAARADFGVGETSLLLARQEGKPVVLLANIFQHSALVLAMRHAGSLDPVHTLKGKRVMLDSTDAEIVGYLTKEGLPPKSYDRIDHSLSTQDFLAGKVDAVSVYLTEKHDDLERAGVPCLLLTPRSAGIDFYGDNLFTSEAQIRKHPGRVIAFRDASLKGWEYALDHPEEIIDLIVSRYPSRLDREHLVYEAQQMKELIQPDLIHVGYVNPSRWKEIARTYAGLGMLASDFDLAGFIYQPHATRIPAWLAKGLAAVAAILFLGFLLVLFVLRANRRLARSEKKLADSEARFRLAFDNANTGMCLVGLEGKILQANEKMAVIFGYSMSELEGMSVADLAVPEETDISLKFMREAIEGDKESVTYEKRYLHRMGRTIYGLIAASLIRDDHGKPLYFISQVLDITERKEAEDEILKINRQLAEATAKAERATAAKSEFLATMTHELRNPLTGVLGFAEILAGTPLDDEQQSYTEGIRESGVHLLSLINDVLDFSSIEKGALAIHPAPFGLAHLVKSSSDIVRKSAADKGLAFHCDVAADVPEQITGDERRILQILINLLANAVKFTSEGSVSLRVARSGQGLDFSVADTGLGISSEALARLFQLFTQADSTINQKYGGTGIGLAVSQHLAEAMGGTISVVSAPGKGSTFTFRLPLEVPSGGMASVPSHLFIGADGASPSSPSAEPMARTDALPVLVVEDDRSNSLIVGKILQSLGCRVEFAGNGAEAVEAFAPGKYLAILMDLRMPVMNGFEAAAIIRSRESGSRVPIIALSANVMSGSRELYLAAGMDDFLAKPFKREELAQKLANVVRPRTPCL